jgi:hypothetical protein
MKLIKVKNYQATVGIPLFCPMTKRSSAVPIKVSLI